MRLVPARRASTAVFGIVLVAGLALRLLALRTSLAQQNSDTAIVYLMARHVIHGDWRVFYWGQFYGGTLLQLTAGAIFWLTSPSFAALQIVEIAFWLAACLLLRSVVARSAGAVAGDIAGSLFWLATPLMVSISFSDGGFFGDGLAIGLAALRVAQAEGAPGGRRCLIIGFFLGLALWTNPLALAFAVPAALWLCVRIRSVGAALGGLAGATFGAAPWLYATAKSHLQTLDRLPGAHGNPLGRYLHVFTQIVPGAAGFARDSFQGRAIGVAVLIILILGTAVALLRRNPAVLALGLSGLLASAIIVTSGVPVVPTSARYATYLVPGVAAMIAWALRRMPIVGLVPVLLVSSWTIGTVWNSTDGLARVSAPSVGEPVAMLAKRLERMNRTAVWADYWIAYVLSAETQERVVAADLSLRREESYLISAKQASRTTVVLFPGMANEQTLRTLPGLPRHTRTLVGPFAIWAFNTRVDVGRYLQAGS